MWTPRERPWEYGASGEMCFQLTWRGGVFAAIYLSIYLPSLSLSIYLCADASKTAAVSRWSLEAEHHRQPTRSENELSDWMKAISIIKRGTKTLIRPNSSRRYAPSLKSTAKSIYVPQESTRGSPIRKLQDSKMAHFTNKYFSIWVHMKALNMLFQMRYGSLLSSKKWLRSVPKCRGHLVEASTLRKPKNNTKFDEVWNVLNQLCF